MHTEVESRHHFIIATGSVISFNEDPLTINLPLEGEDLCFVMSFGKDKNNPEKPSVQAIPHSDRRLELKFMNFEYDLGTGNNTPIEVGLINGKNLFLSYRAYSLADSTSRLIHYTFYLEK
jgi:hypothetical protein